MAMFLLDVSLKTGSFLTSNIYYAIRYMIWGHEETDIEKVEKQLSQMHEELNVIKKIIEEKEHKKDDISNSS